MFEIVTIHTAFRGKTLYHPGLVYRPTEQVMYLPTKWASTFKNKNTARQKLKILKAFCNFHTSRIQFKEELDNVILNFELSTNRADIDAWISYRVSKRKAIEGKTSPTNNTIETEANQVGSYLAWVKEFLLKQGKDIPYDGGTKTKFKIKRKPSDKYKGIKGDIEKELIAHNFHVTDKPTPSTPVKALAKRHQSSVREYLKADELGVFFAAFFDKVYAFIAMTAYHTGMRPHEILGLPRYIFYGDNNFFTADPIQLRELMAQGKQTIIFWCLGKGNKLRPVTFAINEWLTIMEAYEPIFQERRTQYQHANWGKDLPLHNLWLARGSKKNGPKIRHCLLGDEITYQDAVKPLQKAVAGAREKHRLVERFGHHYDFYSLRHSFTTNYLINVFKDNPELQNKAKKDPMSLLEDIGFRQRLQNQLGHEKFKTTFKYYVHEAIVAGAVPLPTLTELWDDYNRLSALAV